MFSLKHKRLLLFFPTLSCRSSSGGTALIIGSVCFLSLASLLSRYKADWECFQRVKIYQHNSQTSQLEAAWLNPHNALWKRSSCRLRGQLQGECSSAVRVRDRSRHCQLSRLALRLLAPSLRLLHKQRNAGTPEVMRLLPCQCLFYWAKVGLNWMDLKRRKPCRSYTRAGGLFDSDDSISSLK